jgi:hypothetical protein
MRLLNPQLQYFRANDIPIYGTSQLYEGQPNPNLDIDLNGITFCDAPWLFPEIYQGDLNMYHLQHIWQQFPASHWRLIALGIDAYQVIPHLNTLTSTTFSGATGNLQMTPRNEITRNLVCAKFSHGIPNVIGFTEPKESELEVLKMITTED